MAKDKTTDMPVPDKQEYANIFTFASKYWKTTFKPADFIELYEQHGIAFKVTNKFTNDLTDKNYTTNNTAFDAAGKMLGLNSILNWGFNRAYITGYSLIYLGFNDEGNYDDPYTSKQVPDYLQVIPQSWIATDIMDPENKRPGKYEIYKKDGGTFWIDQTRVVRVQLRADSKSMLLPAYRSLFVADNVLWSTGQGIFRQAAGLTHLQITNPGKVEVDGKTVTEVQAIKSKGILSNINAETSYVSDDRHNFKVHGVTGNMAKPMEYWQIALQSAAMSLNVPWQLILGGNAGVVTGSEINQKDYYAMIQDYRENAHNDVIVELADRFGFSNLIIEYGTLFEETDTEKSEMLERDVKSYVEAIKIGLISKDTALAALNKDYPGYDFKLGEAIAVNNQGFVEQTPSTDAMPVGSGSYAAHKITFYTEWYTKEQALEFVKEKGHVPIGIEADDWEITIYLRDTADFVPGTNRWSTLGNGIELNEAELLATANATDATISKWEKKKYTNHEDKFVNTLYENFYTNVIEDFNIYPDIKGAVQYFDSLKSMSIKRNINKDTVNDVKLVIESKTAKFRETAKLDFVKYLATTWALGIDAANVELAAKIIEPIVQTPRAEQLALAASDNVMSLVTGVSEDMKKDLNNALLDALVNEEGPRQAAKRFKDYVDDAFANKYKNRLLTIARTETLRTLNQSNVQAYKDSGVVDKIQWITASDDRVRPKHRAVNGEVVVLGKQFSLGVTQPPEGVNCRCSVVPYFD